MTHDQRDAVIAGLDPWNDALRIRDREAKPVHAGVDMNGRAALPAGAPAKYVPFGEFVEIANHGPGVDLGIGIAAILEETAKHIDGRGRHGSTRRTSFLQGRDKKCLAAGAGERTRNRIRAATIAVSLDHRSAF